MSSNGSYREVDSPAEVTKQVAQFLWCKPEGVWSVNIAAADVEKLTLSGLGLPPVAARATDSPSAN